MSRILVTGGTGGLGRELVMQLTRGGHTVRLMSRGAPSDGQTNRQIEWARADLASGTGLPDAVRGVDAIIHAATSPWKNTKEVDVLGTRRLLEHAHVAGMQHFVYVSIVGIDRIPLGYYRHKLAAEALVEQSRLPWSILRATQFHTLIDGMLRSLPRLPWMFLPADFQFQLIDPSEVAERMIACVATGPAGRLPDMGGPQVRTLGDLARAWLAARGLRRSVIRIPLPGKVAAGFRQGFNTTPEHADGHITWEDWLHKAYGSVSRSAHAGASA